MHYTFLSMFFILAINLFIHIPLSFSEDDPRFSNCSRLFNCGKLQNIEYPFWGNDRPEYCGLPDFKLNCMEELASIEIQSQSYRVFDINQNQYPKTLQIATKVTWVGNCPSQFTNVSLPSNHFSYSGTLVENITLSYGCPSITQLPTTNEFGCSDTLNYFWVNSMGAIPEELSRCNNTIVVPVLQTLVPSFTSFQSTLEFIIKAGFPVEYDFDYYGDCLRCRGSGGRCGYDLKASERICFCRSGQRCQGPDQSERSDLRLGWKILIGTGVGMIGFALITLFILYSQYHSFTNDVRFWNRKNKSQRLVEEFFKSYGSLAPKRYSYHDIKKITGTFEEKIGEGGYGCVYKGKLVDSRVVAVKLLNTAKGDGHEFINEVASISKTCHVNVVSLLGFCFDGSKRALIYEFMVNGSLEKFIFDQNRVEMQIHLGWESLYKIAVGVARGLEYLHRGCNTRILHFDIKPHNILLDQHFVPKISDFGLAKLCLKNESIISMLDARGTAGYIAPEVFDRNFGEVSHKSDVYSYGKMVLEIVGKRKNIDVKVNHPSEIYFPHWIYKHLEMEEGLGLQGVMSLEEEELARKMILVGLWCIQTNPPNRPTMTKVVEMLEGGVELLQIPPHPNL